MKTQMVRVSRWNREHTYMTGRHARIWHYTYRCPNCGAEKYPLANTSRGKEYFCDCGPSAHHPIRKVPA